MKTYLSILFTLTAIISNSQIKFSAKVNTNKAVVNQVFTYTLSTNANCKIYQPNFGGLQIVGGPYQSSTTSTAIINGKMSRVQTTTYTYQLRSIKTGTYTIGASQMKCANETHNSKAIKINISKSVNTNQSGPNTNKQFYIQIYTDKKEVYIGEPFFLSLKMYSRKQPKGIEEIKFGETNGITKKDLNKSKTNFETNTEIINGVRYYTVVLQQELCYTKKSGDLLIEPSFLSAIFTRGFFQQFRQEANSNSLKIKSKKLPSNKPKNFNGLVGTFKMEHSISKNSVLQGEAIDLNIIISGNGNLNSFDDPILDLPNDFDLFDPEIKNKTSTNHNGTSGSMSYNYVIVPTFYGDFEIPAYSFSYFDLDSKKYKTLSTSKFNIHVEKSDNYENAIVPHQKDVSIEETDIRYIHKNNTELFKNSNLKATTIIHYTLLSIPFLCLWGILFIKKRKNNLSDEDKIKSIKKKAKKSAYKYLEKCKKLQQSGKDTEAVKELSTALKAFIKHKMNLRESDLSIKHITHHLADENTIAKLTEVWNTIEMYQYSPVNASQVDSLIEDTETLINTIDEQL